MRFLSLLLLGTLAVVLAGVNEARAAVLFQAAGGVANGAGDVSPTWPTHAINDVALLFIESSCGESTPSLSVTGGFVLVGTQDTTCTGTSTGTRLTVYWTRATSTAMVPPVITDPGDHLVAQILTYRGAVTTGNPWDVTGGGIKTTASTSVSVTEVTTTVTNTLVVIAISQGIDGNSGTFSGYTNANLGSISERSNIGKNSGNGGGFAIIDGTKATAGATGATTATTTSSSNAFFTIALKPEPTTTLGDGTDPLPPGTALSPGGAATMADAFTFETNSGTDTITDVTVGLGTGAAAGLSLVEITNDNGSTVYGSVANPATDTPIITLSTNTLTATTASTQYKIRITPYSHAAMPAPPGAIYTVTAKINTWSSTNTKLGTDTAGTTVTIDNLSSGDVTGVSGTSADSQVSLTWTNPADATLSQVLVLRQDLSPVVGPTEGQTIYMGSSTVVYNNTSPIQSATINITDTGLTNGTSYYYKIFTRDSIGNYSAGVEPTGSPLTPFGPGCYAVAGTLATPADWSSTSTWANSSGGTAPCTVTGTVGNLPASGVPVFIGETATVRVVTIPAAYTARAAAVTLGSTTTGAKSLTLSAASSSLEVGGGIVINNPSDSNTNVLNINAGTVTAGSVRLNGTSANNARIARINITAGTLTINGGLTYTAAGAVRAVIDMSGGAGTLNLAGALTVNTAGTLTPGTTSTFNFNGTSVAQTIPVGLSSIIYNNLYVNNTSASGATLGTNNVTAARVTGNLLIQSGILNDGGFTITGAGGKTFDVANGATFVHMANGWVSGFTRTLGATSTVEYARAGNQTVDIENYGHLTLRGSGTKTLPAGTLSVVGNLSMGGTATLDHNNGTVNLNGSGAQSIALNSTGSNLNNLTIANTGTGVTATGNVSLVGNFTNNGVFSGGTSTFIFAGNNPQTIGGTSATTFYNLTASNTDGGVNDIVLSGNTTVNNSLTFTAGNISTGSNILIIGNTTGCGVTGAAVNQHVIGYLRKNFTASLLDCTFEVGEGTVYAPVRMVFNSVTTPGYVTASTTVGDHPQIATSGINSSLSVNRYWTLTKGGGLVSGSYLARFVYNASDLDGGVAPEDFIAKRYDGAGWSNTTLSSSITPSDTTTVIDGESGFGDFAIGQSSISDFSYEREFIFTREIYY